ncbi:protease [Brevibacillus reuszeri]|uniref:Protease n=1 Tax=Brevibacillus reuszeri TaxID=54915 RepID=A0A0K9Z043_9BACL|nr:transglutaminase domain-containing protein [Brevibacillus reuszeri]KNB74252.1 transglutaminase [Brevibacillus reuszeri]MED1856137.1 transglutaminaseTgpA domain-containing protein [Brevibacillus reuszeri]GED68177.1 protease [Brevibacillus reuszeri]
MNVWKRPALLEWVSALLLFLLLREWLFPMQELTDTGILWPFFIISAGVLIIDVLVPFRWMTFPIKLLGLLWLLHATLFDTPLFETEWLAELYGNIVRDFPLVMHQNWADMSLVSRNAMFDLALLILISMLTYLVLEQRQGLWFVFLTELYLCVLDTFLPYDASAGIVRAFIYGFLLLMVSHFTKMTSMASLSGKRARILGNSLLASMLVIGVSVGIGYAAPKKDASWPDPVAFLTGSDNNAPVGVMKKVGYDNNDERLGGPFLQDNTLVFIATTNERSYWRGDSKDVYTGVGWEKEKAQYESILDPQKHEWKDTLFHGFETKKVNASLEFKGPQQFATVFYPGQLQKVSNYAPPNATVVYDMMNQQLEVHAGKTTLIQIEGEHEKSVTRPNGTLLKLNQYNLEAEVPIVSEKAVTQAGTDYPQDIRERYLQLPATLPPRVKELAQTVTKDAKTPYEKVRAIENYLRSSGKYKYETKDVPVPQEGQDFVDHFLFDSMRGYCDHFSTSMAVMLRTLDIPTRWVKGFAPGERVGTDSQNNEIMEIRNKDAHSWVEVYFPGHGWIPFEATSTFMSPVRFHYDLQTSQPQIPIPLPDLGNTATPDRGDGRLDNLEEGDQVSGKRFSIPWQVNAGVVALLAVAGVVAYRRKKDIQVWWLRRQIHNERSTQYKDRFNLLMRMVESVYARRQAGETLREYVNRLTIPGDKRQDLRYLTEMYERAIYGFKEMEQKARTVAEQVIERLIRQLKP